MVADAGSALKKVSPPRGVKTKVPRLLVRPMGSTKLAVAVVVAVFLVLALGILSFVTGVGLGLPEAGFLIGILTLMAVNFGLIIAAIVHALVRTDLTGAQRIAWIAIAFFVTPVVAVGAIVYFALGRERTRELFRDLGAPSSPPAPPASPPPPTPPIP